MKSKFVNIEEFGRDADLGFMAPTGSGSSGSSGLSLQNVGDNANSVSQIVNAAGSVFDSIGSIFGGGGKTFTDCGAKQRQAEKIFQQYFTTDDARQLLQDAEQNVGPVTGYSITDLAFHYLGGDDCQVTTSIGRAWSHRVEALLQQRQQEAQQKSKNPLTTAASFGGKGLILPIVLGVGGLGILTAVLAGKKK